MYKLVIEKYALKNIAKIAPAHLPTIRDAMTSSAQNPRPQGYKKLKGISAQEITGSFMKFTKTLLLLL